MRRVGTLVLPLETAPLLSAADKERWGGLKLFGIGGFKGLPFILFVVVPLLASCRRHGRYRPT